MGYPRTVIPKMVTYTQNIIDVADPWELLMQQYIQINCPSCQSPDLVKNGPSENGTQRYRCNTCKRSFQWEYRYLAWLPDTNAQIEEQTLNGSGVSDISRNLKIAKHTVISTLKKPPHRRSILASPNA
jgi:transposase